MLALSDALNLISDRCSSFGMKSKLLGWSDSSFDDLINQTTPTIKSIASKTRSEILTEMKFDKVAQQSSTEFKCMLSTSIGTWTKWHFEKVITITATFNKINSRQNTESTGSAENFSPTGDAKYRSRIYAQSDERCQHVKNRFFPLARAKAKKTWVSCVHITCKY